MQPKQVILKKCIFAITFLGEFYHWGNIFESQHGLFQAK